MTNTKTILRRVAIAVATVMVLAGAGVMALVHTDKFRQFVLAEIVRQSDAALGGRLSISSMAIDWRLLEVDFYGVTLHGTEADTQPPLVQADHLRVGLKIVSMLRRKVDLSEIVLDRPVVYLAVDSRGNSNLPQTAPRRPPASVGSGVADIVDMAIRHVEVNSGQIDYNDREVPLSADLRDFRAQINFAALAGEYRGSLAYDDGRITVQKFKPIAHHLQMNFSLGRSGLVLDPITLTAGNSALTAHAKLANYDNLQISGTYDGVVSTVELREITNYASIPAGQVALSGGFAYQNVANKTMLQSAYVDGKMSSQQLRVDIARKVATVKSIRGDYRLQDGNLEVNNLVADVLGGSINANYKLANITGASSSQVDASIRNISLQQLSDKAAPGNIQIASVTGFVNGTLGATWGSNIQNGIAKVRVDIRSPNPSRVTGSAIPLSGTIDVRYDAAHNVASFGSSSLRAGSTTVAVTGLLSDRSELNAEINAPDLREVASLVSAFETKKTPIPDNLAGSARFQGQVLGSVKNPRLKGELLANNVKVQKAAWRSLQVNVDASSSNVSLQNGSLDDMKKGQVAFSGTVGLQDWAMAPSNPIHLQLSAKQISIDDLQQFTDWNYPVSGLVAANISFHGSGENPAGQGSVQITRASAWNEPIDSLSVNFNGDGDSIHTDVRLAASAGTLTANLAYQPRLRLYDATLTSTGIKLDQLPLEQLHALGVSGSANISASGRGTVTNPQVTANVQIPQLTIRDQVISDVQAQLNFANQHADVTLNSKASQGSIQATADIGTSGEYPATASLDVHAIPIAVVLASYLHVNPRIQGQAELHATLKGPLKDPDAVVAQLEIPTLNLAYQSTNLGLVRPLRVSYEKGVATIEDGEFKGTGTDFSVKGTVPVKSALPLNVSANGTIDLSIIQGLEPDIRSSGRIDLNLSARGDIAHPAMQGQIHIVNGTMSSEGIPVGFEGINGTFQMSGNRIDIAQFSGTAGGGNVSAHGFMTYGEPSTFNMGLDLKSVRLRYPEGIRSVLSGNLNLNGSAGSSQLTGRVLVDKLSFTQQFDLANFLSQFATDTPSTPPSAFEHNMKLNVTVATSEDLNLENSKVSIGGSANLNLGGNLADPVVLGRTTLTAGDIFFMGKRYTVQSGTIEFANPNRTTPILNLYVNTTVQQYNITLNFVGPPNRLVTNYTSDPALPPADIINLIAFGQTSEQQATSASTPASVGAESVLAQGAASQVSGKIEKLTGISQLTIDPLANSQANPGSQVAIQERVTGNILLTFSTDVTNTENQTVQLQYQVKKNLSISVLRDQYDGYAADVKIHKTF